MKIDKTTLKKRGNYYDVVMPIIKAKLQQAIKNNLNYYETVQRQMDAHQTKTASIQIRKNGLKGNKYIIIKMSMIEFAV